MTGGGLRTVKLGTERFEVAEGIFKPEVWGQDQAGVHVLVKKAIAECSLDVRREVSQSIFLSGGLTMLPGFKQRLEAELERLLPAKPRVHASPYRWPELAKAECLCDPFLRQHAAFLGAQAHALSPAYSQARILRADWVSGAAKNTASLWPL
jgi:actin beta/gamma 1